MSKCLICNSKKGKRQCVYKQGLVCSHCCGTTRTSEICGNCLHYHEPKQIRNYKQVPAFTVQAMDGSSHLQSYSNAIEAALCAFDQLTAKISDRTALRVIELLMDKHHFNAPPSKFDDPLIENTYIFVDKVVENDMTNAPNETITKILGVIYRVATRRSQGNREYMDFISKYVGVRVTTGVRVFPR